MLLFLRHGTTGAVRVTAWESQSADVSPLVSLPHRLVLDTMGELIDGNKMDLLCSKTKWNHTHMCMITERVVPLEQQQKCISEFYYLRLPTSWSRM